LTKTQTRIIEEMFLECIDSQGMIDKREIMKFVLKKLDVPQPTVRRVKANMIKRYKNYIKILSGKNETNKR